MFCNKKGRKSMLHLVLLILLCGFVSGFSSCNWVTPRTEEAANKKDSKVEKVNDLEVDDDADMEER